MIKEKKQNAINFIFDMCNIGDSCVSVICNMLQSGFLEKKQMDKLIIELVKKNKLQARLFMNSLQEWQVDYSNIVRIK